MIPKNDSPIKLHKLDGLYQLDYFGKLVGYISKIKIKNPDRHTWRAVSVGGEVKHCWSLDGAQRWLMDQYC